MKNFFYLLASLGLLSLSTHAQVATENTLFYSQSTDSRSLVPEDPRLLEGAKLQLQPDSRESQLLHYSLLVMEDHRRGRSQNESITQSLESKNVETAILSPQETAALKRVIAEGNVATLSRRYVDVESGQEIQNPDYKVAFHAQQAPNDFVILGYLNSDGRLVVFKPAQAQAPATSSVLALKAMYRLHEVSKHRMEFKKLLLPN